MSEVKAITAIHQRELSAYEKTIERGIGTFVEVGNALREIRDQKLYKLTHKTFEAYVKERWNWSRPRAYQLIEAAEVDEGLSTNVDKKPTSEAQAREVAKAPPEKQAAVVEAVAAKAASEDREPTARDYKAAVAELEYEDCDDGLGLDVELPPPVRELPQYDTKVINAWSACEVRIGTLRRIVSTLASHEVTMLLEFLQDKEVTP